MFDREIITSVHLPTLTAFSLQIGENLTFYYRIKKFGTKVAFQIYLEILVMIIRCLEKS